MTSHRPYRPGMPVDKALAIIATESGKQFDARFAATLIQLGSHEELHHVVGHSDEGIPLQHCPQCGPTLTLTKRARAGQRIYCRNCTGEFELVPDSNRLLAKPTGGMGRAADLEADLDIELVERTVKYAVAALPSHDLILEP